MKRPYLSVEVSEEPDQPVSRRKRELKELLLRFVVRSEDSPTGSSGQPSYPWLISFLAPLALEWLRKVRTNVVISLDDQLEWQATSRSHSPKAPTPPMIMRTLKETPPASPSEEVSEGSPSELQPADVALAMREIFSAVSGVARLGPRTLALLLPGQPPLRLRADAPAAVPEISDQLSAADLWLLGAAVTTYDSHFAATVRSRRSLVQLSEALVLQIREFLFAGASAREAELGRRREAREAAGGKRKFLEERIREVQTKIEKLEKIRKSRADRDIAVALLKKQEKPRPLVKAVPEETQARPAPEVAKLPEESLTSLRTSEERELAVEWLRLNFRARDLAETKSALEKKARRISVLLAETSKKFLALPPPIKTIPA